MYRYTAAAGYDVVVETRLAGSQPPTAGVLRVTLRRRHGGSPKYKYYFFREQLLVGVLLITN